VAINAMLLSMLFKATPDQVRLIMIDPKMLELNVYEGIPHLIAPVVTDMNQAANALRWCVAEMERRYKIMAALGVRNIAGHNRKIKEAKRAGCGAEGSFFHAYRGKPRAPEAGKVAMKRRGRGSACGFDDDHRQEGGATSSHA